MVRTNTHNLCFIYIKKERKRFGWAETFWLGCETIKLTKLISLSAMHEIQVSGKQSVCLFLIVHTYCTSFKRLDIFNEHALLYFIFLYCP